MAVLNQELLTCVGSVLFSSYEYFTICDSNLINSGEIIKKGPKQMFYEGFVDLTSGDTGCVLNSGIMGIGYNSKWSYGNYINIRKFESITISFG